MDFSRQEYQSVVPFPTPGDLPNLGIEPRSFVFPALSIKFFYTSVTWEALYWIINLNTTALISHASKVMLKILQARLQQYVNCELPDVQAGVRKGKGTRDQCQHPMDHRKSESSRKTSISAVLTVPKPLTVWITINCGNFWKRWEYQTTWSASWETYMQVRKQQLELDMNNRVVPNRKRSTSRLHIVTLLI